MRQGLITGAVVKADHRSGVFAALEDDGWIIQLTVQQNLGVASYVRSHVQACFNREAALLDAVADGTHRCSMRAGQNKPNIPFVSCLDWWGIFDSVLSLSADRYLILAGLREAHEHLSPTHCPAVQFANPVTETYLVGRSAEYMLV